MPVRIVQTNGIDLSMFQWDYDLTFAVFFLNADGEVYGRYGARSGREAEDDISIDGLAKAMQSVLALHAAYPANRALLVGKKGPLPRHRRPELLPPLRDRYTSKVDFDGQASRSCIHCHQIRDARRLMLREAGQPLSAAMMFPFPMPRQIGLALKPDRGPVVDKVAEKSAAAEAGFKTGDEILTLGGQAIISIADVQWVLHNAQTPTRITAVVRRKGGTAKLQLALAANWRRGVDISWRPTTWDLRRMGSGGILLEELPAKDRRRAGIAADSLALRAKHVGQYGEHAAAKRAGFRKGDVIVAFDGLSKQMTESELLAYTLIRKRKGERVKVVVMRGERRLTLQLPMQ